MALTGGKKLYRVTYLILSFVCFLLGNYPASGFYMPTFRNTLFHLHRQVEGGTDSVPKRRHIKSRRRVITQKKEYNIWEQPKQIKILFMKKLRADLSQGMLAVIQCIVLQFAK